MHKFDVTVKKTDKFILVKRYDKPVILPDNKGYRGIRGQARNPEASLKSSLKRTKGIIYDYAIANEWNYWVTLTLDKSKIDRFNFSLISKKIRKWFNNQKRNYQNLKWLIVPEMHRNGAWHFHALISGLPLGALVDSGKRTIKNQIIYNWIDFQKSFGFNTVIDISHITYDEHLKIANYITKYITKELVFLTPNQQRYWVSKGLNKPDREDTFNEYVEVNSFDVPIIRQNLWHIQDKETGEILNSVLEVAYLRLPY